MSRFTIIEETMARTTGEVWECGCFNGDFAATMLPFLGRRILRLFDTFEGMPASGPNDRHAVGAMRADLSLVCARFELWTQVAIHVGRMPGTFTGLEEKRISVVNLDVDNEQCIRECLPWLYERLEPGGCLAIDDYNCSACPGARQAVDEFMRDKPERLIPLDEQGASQAHFIKL